MSRAGLQHALKKRPESQAEVLYILTETRKALEELNLRKQYPDLVFFCDWTVHPKLSRSGSVKPLIDEFSTALEEVLRQKSTAPITGRVRKIISLELLREELCSFLVSQSLTVDHFTNDTFWAFFVVLYISIVYETPLELTSGNRIHLRCRRIGPDPQNPKSRTVYITEWVITRNGVELGAIGNEGFMQTVSVTKTLHADGTVTTTTEIKNYASTSSCFHKTASVVRHNSVGVGFNVNFASYTPESFFQFAVRRAVLVQRAQDWVLPVRKTDAGTHGQRSICNSL